MKTFGIVVLLLLPCAAIASGYGSGAMLQGLSEGLQDIRADQRGDYTDIEYRRQMREHERLKQQAIIDRMERQAYQQEQLRLLRDQNEILRQR